MSDVCGPWSETDTITKSHRLAGVGCDAGISWPLSAAKSRKMTRKWDEAVSGPHALLCASLCPGLTLRNPKASLDSLFYHPTATVTPD